MALEHDELHMSVEDDEELDESESAGLGDEDVEPKKSSKKKKDPSALRKAPQAPKRFKSSYICFFMAKQNEIKDELGEDANVASISKRSAQIWKSLPAEEKLPWDEVAAKDKQRYMNEKATYTGPWQVPWKRAKKDPSAPKRPMSAFLFFSQGKRSEIKKENADMKNTEVSRILGEMWRNLTEEERSPYVNQEKQQRAKYKVAMAQWRTEFEAREEAQKKYQAEQAASMPEHPQPHMFPDNFPVMHQYPPPAYMYPPPAAYYPYQPGPYPFPTNGKTPVILGPTGTPVYPSHAPAPAMHAAYPPHQAYDDGGRSQGSPGEPFDYGVESAETEQQPE